MAKATRATRWLSDAGVAFTVHEYAYDPAADSIGLQAADALGEVPGRLLNTLTAWVDGKPVCAIVPADREVAMKKLAAACGGKHAEMMKPADAERVSGYKVGGISPFGQPRSPCVVMEQAAILQAQVYINGGQRGLQVRLDPRDALRALGGTAAAIAT